MSRSVVTGLLRLFRFELPFAAAACVVLGQFLALDGVPPMPALLLAPLSVFCISATALILNDCFDVETDRVNAPHRPIPSGQVTVRAAALLSGAVALAGLSSAAALGMRMLALVTVVWIVGVLYNWRFKRTGLPGNLMVAFSVGTTFVAGGVSVERPWSGAVWWFAAIAFLMDLGEEIAADAMDADGDRLINSRSLALRYGSRTALRISAGVFFLLFAVSAAPLIAGAADSAAVPPIILMDTVLVISLVRLLAPAPSDPRGDIRRIYLGGLAAVLLYIVLRAALLF